MTPESFLLSFGSESRMVKLWMKFQAAQLGCRLYTNPYAWDLSKGSRILRIGRRHFQSAVDLARDFDAYFDSLVPTRIGSRNVLDFSHIQMHHHRASGQKFELLHWPELDSVIQAYVRHFQPGEGDLVFDVGAGCGVSTFALSNMARQVIAYEPDPHLRAILERNMTRLRLANVTIVPKAVPCLQTLTAAYGVPAFCKVNLDQTPDGFFDMKPDQQENVPAHWAASSRLRKAREEWTEVLSQNGFYTESDPGMGLVWATRATGLTKYVEPEQSR